MTAMAGIGGLVGGLAGLLGANNASSITPPTMYQLPNQTAAGNSAYSTIGNLASTYGSLGASTLGSSQSAFNTLYNNPGTLGLLSGAQTGSQLGTSAALGAYGAGNSLTSSGTSMLPYAQSIMQTAMDPQNALYAQTQGTNNQQNAANLANSGLLNSPYGQSVLGNANTNFNIDWQNNQLAREATGASAAGGLLSNAGGAINTGTGISNAAGTQYANAAALPYSAYSTLGTGQNTAISSLLGNYSSAQSNDTQSLTNLLNYLGVGNASNAAANSLYSSEVNASTASTAQNLAYGNALGSALKALGGTTTSNSPLLGSLFSSSSPSSTAYSGYNVTGLPATTAFG